MVGWSCHAEHSYNADTLVLIRLGSLMFKAQTKPQNHATMRSGFTLMRKDIHRCAPVVLRCTTLAVVLTTCGSLTGCVKTLLNPKEPRSQYSRYELVRGQFAPQYIEDEYGRRKPNLRGRLLQPE